MRFRLQFRRYRLPFRTPVRTAHGPWVEREGLLIRLEHDGAVGWGEAAPIPWFGTETVDEAEAACRSLGEWIDGAACEHLPPQVPCLRHAIAAARRELDEIRERMTRAEDAGNSAGAAAGSDSSVNSTQAPGALGVAALLPAGRAVLAQISPKADAGFRVFKWKVGVGDLADELALLDDVCATLPSGAKLRLDANGAWDRRKAERWLERCADRPVEFVEQPCLAAVGDGPTAQRKVDDMLLGLAEDYPTPLALDESLVRDGDVERWIGAGWRGIFVVKPALLADVPVALARLEKAQARVVFSSALETAVGARTALQVAFAWPGERERDGAVKHRALGFGVWPLFADARFDGPAAAPFIRREDVARINVEVTWNALS